MVSAPSAPSGATTRQPVPPLVNRERLLLVIGRHVLFGRHDPDLKELHRVVSEALNSLCNAAPRAHTLRLATTQHAVATRAIAVREGAGRDDRDDLHVVVVVKDALYFVSTSSQNSRTVASGSSMRGVVGVARRGTGYPYEATPRSFIGTAELLVEGSDGVVAVGGGAFRPVSSDTKTTLAHVKCALSACGLRPWLRQDRRPTFTVRRGRLPCPAAMKCTSIPRRGAFCTRWPGESEPW